jgi:NMD protein affecting ribosome stability and mRNA decay
MFGAPERLPAFGVRTFSTVITTSMVQNLNEKIAGVDYMMRWLSIALHVLCQFIASNFHGSEKTSKSLRTLSS